MTAIYYHVTGPKWQPGDDLFSWDELENRGLITDDDWKWGAHVDGGADRGHDTEYVSLAAADSWSNIEDIQALYGDVARSDIHVLRITIPDHERDHVIIKNAEGYPAVLHRIPAEWITVVTGEPGVDEFPWA